MNPETIICKSLFISPNQPNPKNIMLKRSKKTERNLFYRTSISIPLDPLNQRDVSHGFVTLWDPVDAEHAVIELDGLMVGRYPITVVEMI